MEHPEQDHKKILDAARVLQENRSGIVLTGRIVNGKVELDKETQEAISKQFASSTRRFIAVNAPFDPQTSSL
jgi:hypothetical protein